MSIEERRVPLFSAGLKADGLANDDGPLVHIPTAWMRRVKSPSTPNGPGEVDVDLRYGDDPPEGEGWTPLYRHVDPDNLRFYGDQRLIDALSKENAHLMKELKDANAKIEVMKSVLVSTVALSARVIDALQHGEK